MCTCCAAVPPSWPCVADAMPCFCLQLQALLAFHRASALCPAMACWQHGCTHLQAKTGPLIQAHTSTILKNKYKQANAAQPRHIICMHWPSLLFLTMCPHFYLYLHAMTTLSHMPCWLQRGTHIQSTTIHAAQSRWLKWKNAYYQGTNIPMSA